MVIVVSDGYWWLLVIRCIEKWWGMEFAFGNQAWRAGKSMGHPRNKLGFAVAHLLFQAPYVWNFVKSSVSSLKLCRIRHMRDPEAWPTEICASTTNPCCGFAEDHFQHLPLVNPQFGNPLRIYDMGLSENWASIFCLIIISRINIWYFCKLKEHTWGSTPFSHNALFLSFTGQIWKMVNGGFLKWGYPQIIYF